MKKNKCEECEHFEQCEIKLIVHNSISQNINYYQDGSIQLYGANNKETYTVHKGDKIAQITLMKHYSSMFGINSKETRSSGIGSTS